MNWVALGRPDFPRSSAMWIWLFSVAYGLELMLQIAKMAVGHELQVYPYLTGLVAGIEICWYLFSSYEHMRFVEENYGNSYGKRPIFKAALIGVAGWIAFEVVSFAGLLAGSVAGKVAAKLIVH
jgi:hypothetical protein